MLMFIQYNIIVQIIFCISKILENAGNRKMGLQLDGEDFLHIGLINDSFNLYLGQALC